MTWRINNNTTLKAIVNQVARDFGIKIDQSTAQDIKGAHKKGCLMWGERGLSTTDSSRIRIVRASDGRVESNV